MLRIAVIALMLGAATTVTVAWGLALRPSAFDVGSGTLFSKVSDTGQEWGWFYWRSARPGALFIMRMPYRSGHGSVRDGNMEIAQAELPAWSGLHEPPGAVPGPPVIEDARGWPLLVLRSTSEYCFSAGRASGFHTRDGLIVNRTIPHEPPTVLPLRPIWPGFLANTAIYGGVWALLLVAPGALRRHRRRRAGSCPACGYDLRASRGDVCPECGNGT